MNSLIIKFLIYNYNKLDILKRFFNNDEDLKIAFYKEILL